MKRSSWGAVFVWTPACLALVGCGMEDARDRADPQSRSPASVTFGQTPMSGNSIPKFVDRLPTVFGKEGRRNDVPPGGDAGIPAEGASGLGVLGARRALQERHLPLGVQHQQRWPELACAHDRGAQGYYHIGCLQ